MKKKSLPTELTGAADLVDDIKARVEALEDKFGDNEKIAKTLCVVAEKIKDFDLLFEKSFVSLIKNSSDIKVAFQSFVDQGDRGAANKLLKRFGFIIGWAASLVITALVTAWITKRV